MPKMQLQLERLTMEDFKYKCKNCETLNLIPADWFRDPAEKKIYACTGCGNKVKLNIARIRKDFYDNFNTATELVIGRKPKLSDLYLKINVNEEIKKLLKLEKETIRIGRGKEINSDINRDENGQEFQKIQIPDKYISSKHCELKYNPKNNKITIQDLGSLNKTFLGETELSPDEILIVKPGELIKIGITTLEVC